LTRAGVPGGNCEIWFSIARLFFTGWPLIVSITSPGSRPARPAGLVRCTPFRTTPSLCFSFSTSARSGVRSSGSTPK
jgi:hypothetical protein